VTTLSSHRPRLLGALFLLLAATGLSCGKDETAVQLVLTPDPDLSPLEAMLPQLGKLSVIVDGEGGLAGVGGTGDLPGGGRAVDWDGDGDLEARFDNLAVGGDALPVLEIGLEANPDRALDFRVLGFDEAASPDSGEGVSLAEGGARVSVPRGQVKQVGAPFNLTSRARPPRVLLVVPTDGATVQANLLAVVAVLSTTVKAATVAKNVALTDPKGKSLSITSVKVETTVVAGGAYSKESRSLLTIAFSSSYEKGTYHLKIGPGIESTSGRRFDQDPETSAEDAFQSSFYLDISVGSGQPCDSCPSGYSCDKVKAGCIPDVTCAGGCGTGLVCDASQKQCVADCRKVGLCFDPKQTCSDSTGLCW
jgi:hypothetical protein